MKRLVIVLLVVGALGGAAAAIASRDAAPTGRCTSPGSAGATGEWKVLLGVKSSLAQAQTLVRSAQRYGFKNLEIEIQGPRRYAVALNALTTRAQLTDEIKQVRTVPQLKIVGTETVLTPCR